MSEPDTLRLCRINGRQPTTREGRKAFHQLWRLDDSATFPLNEVDYPASSFGGQSPVSARYPCSARRTTAFRVRSSRCRCRSKASSNALGISTIRTTASPRSLARPPFFFLLIHPMVTGAFNDCPDAPIHHRRDYKLVNPGIDSDRLASYDVNDGGGRLTAWAFQAGRHAT